MSKVSITRSLLDDLAMSISTKSGEPVPMTLTEMKDAVDSIQTGGGGSVTQDQDGYIVLPSTGGGGGGATQHTIHLEFSDSTDTDVSVYYDDSLIGTMITAYEPSTWTYSSKTVVVAELDGTEWYNKQNIPLNTQLIDYTSVTADTAIGSDGNTMTQQWYYASDYTPVESGMTFSYKGGLWFYIGVYNSSKTCINTIYIYSDGTVDPNDSNTGYGTLSGNKLPSGSAYIRLCGTYYDSDHMSLIRTA